MAEGNVVEGMDFEGHLKDLGFSQNEAKVYLALLETGSSNVGKIARKSKVHRTNVYDALESLTKKGLVSCVLKENVKFFEAIDPENLINLLKEKENKLNLIMPYLKLRHTEKKEIVRSYEGVQAVRNIFNNFLTYKKPIYTYGVPKEAVQQLTKHFMAQYHKKRIANKIWMLHIYNEDVPDRIALLNKLPYTGAKYLPKESSSVASTRVCGDEVVITHYTNKPTITILIKNKELAETYKKYFCYLWKISSPKNLKLKPSPPKDLL